MRPGPASVLCRHAEAGGVDFGVRTGPGLLEAGVDLLGVLPAPLQALLETEEGPAVLRPFLEVVPVDLLGLLDAPRGKQDGAQGVAGGGPPTRGGPGAGGVPRLPRPRGAGGRPA